MPKALKREDGVVAANNWLKVADKAFFAYSQAPHGGKEAALRSEAASHGVAPQTLRRLLAGRQFLDRLLSSEPGLAQALRSASFAAVEVIARWHRWDRHGAADAARQLLSEATSVRALAAAEQEARRARGETRVQRLPRDVASQIGEAIVAHASSLLDRKLGVTWASHSYRTALTQPREPAMFARLRELGASPSGISLVLADDTSGPELAVVVMMRHPRMHAFAGMAQLAGLHHRGFGGLFVTFEPDEAEAFASLAREFLPARIDAITLNPELLLALPPDHGSVRD
ncbi:MAG: hypothetical protein DI537_37105 [Stutzerimonas stutzeri]|nr:MAG: hypothetical protein DI537_37105 [Stutzerimonas stutzeri]